MKYIIGTRGSKLALAQSEMVRKRLEETYPEDTFECKIIKTKGDLIQDKPLDQIGDKGLFVREIEQEILNDEIQMGVHSMKDMPAKAEAGLMFTKSWKREDPRDVLILREKKSLSELPFGAVIGTGSKRRQYQLLKLRPDLKLVDIRGNVDTRIRKMNEQKLDGIVLAAAGLHRLGMQDVITQYLDEEEMISAPAQGILALEIREDNKRLQEMLDALSDEETEREAAAERTFLEQIGGDCHVPIGAVCKHCEEGLTLRCVFGAEDGSRMAYACVTGTEPEELAMRAVKAIGEQMSGKVILVGGGPGDPGLITVKGLKAIQKADCIVYDRLSSPGLLEETKPGCEKIYVGKANRHHTMKQDEINELLVKKAREYRIVVRLKGGDVYVFGRGGEEALYLKERGISCEIIPGISSSLAGLAYAGIPITHRGVATGFHVVTAHNKRDELAEIDFKSMAMGRDTCVFLMGLSKLPKIAQGLLDAGMDGETSAAVISSATTNRQKTVVASLKNINEKVREAGLESPALIVVGNVVKLREKLNFFEEQKLFGKKFIVPKIGEKLSGLTERLTEQGAVVKEIQVGEIRRIPQTFTKEQLQKTDWLILTSKNGVEGFVENLLGSGLDMRALGNTKIAVIGAETEKYLKKQGLRADLVPADFHSDALKESLKQVLKKEDTVLYPKAENADSSMKDALSPYCHFTEIPVYNNAAVSCEPEWEEESFDGILFTCASSAERFFAKTGREKLGNDCRIYSIGPKCSEALEKMGITDYVQAEHATYENLAESILKQE